MNGLTLYHLRVTMQAQQPIRLGEHKGAAVRGALIGAMRRHYCTEPTLAVGASQSWHVGHCPACQLLAGEDDTRTRGQNPPRAYVVDPPLDPRARYDVGDTLSFGLSLFAGAIDLYPYLLSSLSLMGAEGIGDFLPENGRKRGKLMLKHIEAVNPLTRERITLYREGAGTASAQPALPVTHDLVQLEAQRWPADRLTLRFLTPTRVISQGRLSHRAEFLPIFKRLIERIGELWTRYADAPLHLDADALIEQAARIECVADETHWVDVQSSSERTRRSVPIGGFVGTATYQGDFTALREWLLWGQVTHVGKNVVKGDGWYEMLP